MAELYGKLANIFADLPNKRLQSSSMFKTLVSGDRITAERKHEHPFAFRNHAKLIFSANALPGSNDRTYAFYRRWLIIPFEQTFNGKRAILPRSRPAHQTQSELPGILNYALEGAQRLYANGDFTETEHTRKAKADYQRSNDSVQAFVEECVDIARHIRHQAGVFIACTRIGAAHRMVSRQSNQAQGGTEKACAHPG